MNFVLRATATVVRVTALDNGTVKFYRGRVKSFIVTESRTLALVPGLGGGGGGGRMPGLGLEAAPLRWAARGGSEMGPWVGAQGLGSLDPRERSPGRPHSRTRT